jgi:hypothetical protein
MLGAETEVWYLLVKACLGYRCRPFCATPRPWNMNLVLTVMLLYDQGCRYR